MSNRPLALHPSSSVAGALPARAEQVSVTAISPFFSSSVRTRRCTPQQTAATQTARPHMDSRPLPPVSSSSCSFYWTSAARYGSIGHSSTGFGWGDCGDHGRMYIHSANGDSGPFRVHLRWSDARSSAVRTGVGCDSVKQKNSCTLVVIRFMQLLAVFLCLYQTVKRGILSGVFVRQF